MAMTAPSGTCELCATSGGELLWTNSLYRIVLIAEPDYPGFCRVILNRHEREMSDLTTSEQQEVMQAVFAVEAILRRLINPDKINLASLGNMTPHVHWHIIPRWHEDRCFPNPIWGPVQKIDASIAVTIDTARLKEELISWLGEPIATPGNCSS